MSQIKGKFIANDAITADKIPTGAVDTDELAAAAVTEAKLDLTVIDDQTFTSTYTPGNYTPAQVGTEGNDKISAHLKGIDSAISGASTDVNVKVSANDTTTKYLEDALVVAQGSNTTNILEVSTLNDGADEDLQIQIDQAKIDHDSLLNFAANEHIDHSTVSVNSGAGLSGGGDLTATRTLALDINGLTADTIAAADTLAFYDADGADHNKVAFSSFEGALNHDNLTGFVANEHIDWTNASANFLTTGTATVDGSADSVQLTVQGHSTQTNDILLVENSAQTTSFSVDSAGTASVNVNAGGTAVFVATLNTNNRGTLSIHGAANTPAGNIGHFTLKNTNTSTFSNLAAHTNNSGAADANATGSIFIESGNKTAGTGDSGDISLQTGTSTGGVRGDIVLNGLQINASSSKIVNVTDPTAAQDAATKAYVDAGDNTPAKETFVLIAADITNQYIDLADVAKTDSIHFLVKGAGAVLEGASYEYTVSYTGGAGGNTRISFENDIATGGPSALTAGDVVQVVYLS